MNKMGTLLLAAAMAAGCLATAAPAEMWQNTAAEPVQIESQTVDGAPVSLSAPATHTEAEILAAYQSNRIDLDREITYTVQPDLSGNYSTAGDISEDDRRDALQTLNLLRYIAGLNSVTLDADYNTMAQTASAVMAASGQFGHTITQPAGCSQVIFNTALAGVSGSDIAFDYKNINRSILNAYMYDGGSNNVTTLGHRRWLLNPAMGKTGFGIAVGADGKGRTATYVKDKSNTATQPGYVAWPAAVTPHDLWTGPMSFQFKCNSNSIVTDAESTITSRLEGKTYHFNEASEDNGEGICHASVTSMVSYCGCIIFGKDFAAGDDLDVTVSYTLDGQAYSTHYTVKLLDMSAGNASEPKTDGAEAFADRLYTVFLDRDADEAGRRDWADRLENYQISGTKAAYGFVFSEEFVGKNYTDAEYVEHLYEALMGRSSDAVGKADWVEKLAAGTATREDVFYGFADSAEFEAICSRYGMVSRDIETFVTRLYSVCLDRTPDGAGLADWSAALRSKEHTGREVAYGFIFSPEFRNKEYSDEAYVEHLYAAFLGRTSDDAGLADWVERLKNGKSREAIFDGFVGSDEFSSICENFDIVRG